MIWEQDVEFVVHFGIFARYKSCFNQQPNLSRKLTLYRAVLRNEAQEANKIDDIFVDEDSFWNDVIALFSDHDANSAV